MKEMNPLDALRTYCDRCGTQRKAAVSLGISQAYLSDLLLGRREFSPAMLEKLGLRKIVVKAS